MERIPLLDLKAQYHVIRNDAIAAFDRIAESCAFAQGPDTARFEQEFAAWCGAQHAVSVNSGTSALHIALHCLDIGPGDEVITVPMTFIATVWAIYYVGAKPVFVDIDPARRTLDPTKLEKAITTCTKAIIPVHLYGQPAEMDEINRIADKHGIPVIEDAAQAHGALYHGKRAGTLGQIGCFSFYPGKNLGAFGEGGALVTNDGEIAKRARSLRNHAQSERYYHDELGYNYRMDSMQGAILSLKLKHLDDWNKARSHHAKRYLELMCDWPVSLPQEFPDSQCVWHCFVLETPKRDQIRKKLTANNIESGLHYPLPLHLQKACFKLGYKKGSFPECEHLAENCISLPMFAELHDDQIQQVVDSVYSALNL